jgi:integrase
VETNKLRGDYVDPEGGRMLFGAFVEEWVTNHAQLRPSTLEQRESRLRNHVLPFFQDRPIGSITRSDIQTWVNHRADAMAPSSVVVTYSYLSGAFKAAVEDRLIARTPCQGIRLPRIEHPPVQPIATAAVHRLVDSVPSRYRALLITAAGTGMRQGECFGLTVDRVDTDRGVIVIDRQMVQLSGQTPHLRPPKTPASYRTIPLPDLVAKAIAAQVRDYGTGTTFDASGREVSGVIFTGATNMPVRRSSFGEVWRPAVKKAGLARGTRFHELRHYYASVLIEAGESVKVIQARLGHKSAVETLDTYGHLWPDTEERTRSAIDLALGAIAPDVDHS